MHDERIDFIKSLAIEADKLTLEGYGKSGQIPLLVISMAGRGMYQLRAGCDQEWIPRRTLRLRPWRRLRKQSLFCAAQTAVPGI